ncbi:hypothetical protein GCM10025734_16970 [Kitasatospora paranensis]
MDSTHTAGLRAGNAVDGHTAAAPFLAGRTALITGAASGIGRSCAVAFAAAGARVYVVDRAADAAKAVAEEVGGTALAVDLSDPVAVDGLPEDADIVVNNAGLQHVAPIHDFPPERFQLIQRVMVEAPSGSSAAPCPTCTSGSGDGSSTSPRCTACGPAPSSPRTSPPSTPWKD